MKRNPGDPFRSTDPKYGPVYHVGSAEDAIALLRAENGYMYQTHPRTKAFWTGFPDQIKDSEQLKKLVPPRRRMEGHEYGSFLAPPGRSGLQDS